MLLRAVSLERLNEIVSPIGAEIVDEEAAPVREYLTVFLVAAAVTYLLGVLAREIALRTGAVARVRDRDVHAVPIPYFGGVAMLGGLTAAYLVGAGCRSSPSEPSVFRDAGVVLVAGAMICLLGRAGRPDRARRADQAGRPGARGGLPGLIRRVFYTPDPRRRQSHPRPPRRSC